MKKMHEHTVTLFALFDALWPRLWASQFDSQPGSATLKMEAIMSLWNEYLEKLPPKVFKRVVFSLKNANTPYIDYPPNLLQFKKLCRAYLPVYSPKSIEIGGSDPKIAREKLKAIAAQLAKKKSFSKIDHK